MWKFPHEILELAKFVGDEYFSRIVKKISSAYFAWNLPLAQLPKHQIDFAFANY
jgi:HD-like signal output (HDOD) protein